MSTRTTVEIEATLQGMREDIDALRDAIGLLARGLHDDAIDAMWAPDMRRRVTIKHQHEEASDGR